MHPALDAITETLCEYVKALTETGVHGVMFDTLFASQSIMSKSMWEEMEGPYIKHLSDVTRDNGAMVEAARKYGQYKPGAVLAKEDLALSAR